MMDEPIDLAHKALDQGNPWFGMGNLLTGNTTQWASGSLTLADIKALQERMFDSERQAETTHSNAESSPVTVESLEAIVKQFPPMDVPLPLVDFKRLWQDDTEEQRGILPLTNIQALQGQMFSMARAEPTFLLRPKYMHWFYRIHAQGQRYARWQKTRKRQRRAAQRRHMRGER